MADSKLQQPMAQLEDFHSIQFTMPDMHSIPRGKVVAGNFKENMAKEGYDLWRGATMLGPRGDIPLSVPYCASSFPSHVLRPCIETLTPWPWCSTEKRRVGNILCDMYTPDGSPDLKCPRQLLKTQLDALREKHALIIKTAFEYEFFAYKENTLEPLGGNRNPFCDMRVWGQHQTLLGELWDTMESMGIQPKQIHPECCPGQWELTTVPYPGVTGADVGFYVKNAVKGFLKTHGYDATFMTRPGLGGMSSALHLNHSLWKCCPSTDSKDNAFLGSDGGLSSTAKHWIAGVLAHAEALSALMSPSINCYRRLHNMVTPSLSTWGMDDRFAFIRARVQGSNVFLENRAVSSAASPYLALAGTVAAGLDGLERQLECPPPMDASRGRELPHTLAEALTALEKDHQLAARLGEDFVDCFVNCKRETEITPLEKAQLTTEEERLAFERDMYFHVY